MTQMMNISLVIGSILLCAIAITLAIVLQAKYSATRQGEQYIKELIDKGHIVRAIELTLKGWNCVAPSVKKFDENIYNKLNYDNQWRIQVLQTIMYKKLLNEIDFRRLLEIEMNHVKSGSSDRAARKRAELSRLMNQIRRIR